MTGQAELAAARLLLARRGLSPEDLLQAAPSRPLAPTFAEYIPVVSAAVSDGARRAYGSYWNRVVERNFGYAVARAYAGHTDSSNDPGATATYVRAGLHELAPL